MSGIEKMPADVQVTLTSKINRYNQLRAQLDEIRRERLGLEALLNEIEAALKELEKVPDDTPVYKAVGGILVRKTKKEVVEELETKKTLTSEKIKKLEENEKVLIKALKDLQEEIGQLVARAQGGRESGVGGGGVAG